MPVPFFFCFIISASTELEQDIMQSWLQGAIYMPNGIDRWQLALPLLVLQLGNVNGTLRPS